MRSMSQESAKPGAFLRSCLVSNSSGRGMLPIGSVEIDIFPAWLFFRFTDRAWFLQNAFRFQCKLGIQVFSLAAHPAAAPMAATGEPPARGRLIR
jgi:hypothetical protein